MSLVNQMLKDLEQRRADPPSSDSLQGLRAAPTPEPPRRRSLWLASLAITAVVGVSIGWYSHGDADIAATAMVAENSLVAPQATALPTELNTAPPTAASTSINATVNVEAATAIPAERAISPRPREQAPAKGINRTVSSEQPALPSNDELEPAPQMRKTARALSTAEQAEARYAAAVSAHQQGDTRVAEQELRTALTLSPIHSAAAEHLAVLLLQQNRSAEAQDTLRNAVQHAAGQLRLSKLLARLLADGKQDIEAMTVLQNVRDAANSDSEYFALLAALQQRQQQYSDAANSYREALALDPRRGAWWMGLGISLEQMRRTDEAIAAYNSALRDRSLSDAISKYLRGRISALESGNG